MLQVELFHAVGVESLKGLLGIGLSHDNKADTHPVAIQWAPECGVQKRRYGVIVDRIWGQALHGPGGVQQVECIDGLPHVTVSG
jgi:hypothetical protein